MFIAVFCVLVILFLIISKYIGAVLLLLGVFCDAFFTNKILRCSGYVINLIVAIGLVIFSIILAYKLTPEILEYIK